MYLTICLIVRLVQISETRGCLEPWRLYGNTWGQYMHLYSIVVPMIAQKLRVLKQAHPQPVPAEGIALGSRQATGNLLYVRCRSVCKTMAPSGRQPSALSQPQCL